MNFVVYYYAATIVRPSVRPPVRPSARARRAMCTQPAPHHYFLKKVKHQRRPVDVEREDVLWQKLGSHDGVEDGGDAIDGDGGVRHAQNAVETRKGERDARLLDRFCKLLPPRSQTCHLDLEVRKKK